MTAWHNSSMEAFTLEGSDECPCDVVIRDGTIRLSYAGDDGPVVYAGSEQGEGHFVLTAPDVGGRASLHRFKDAEVLDGFWTEGGYRGMWRVTLSDEVE